MTSFSGNPSDLCDAIDYELRAIEYFRNTLHYQDERSLDSIDVTLGDLTPSGELIITVRRVACCSTSDDAIRAALDRLIPILLRNSINNPIPSGNAAHSFLA